MIVSEQIRTKIAEGLRLSGMTQTEIAARLGIRPPTVAQYLSSRSMPALDTFANLCKLLDLDANEMLCLIG